MKKIKMMLALLAALVCGGAWAEQSTDRVISINFANNGTSNFAVQASDNVETIIGTVPGSTWVNIGHQNRYGSEVSISTGWNKTETETLNGVKVSWSTPGTGFNNMWNETTTGSKQILRSYYGRASGGVLETSSETISGIPYQKYDLVIYLSRNESGVVNQSVYINDVPYYCGTEDALHPHGTYRGISTSWGNPGNSRSEFEYGRNVMRVKGLTADSVTIALKSNHAFGIAAIQVVESSDDKSYDYPMYCNQLAGTAKIPAGNYGTIKVSTPYAATTYAETTEIGDSNSAIKSVFGNNLSVVTHTVSGWFKVVALPASGNKTIYAAISDEGIYGGYKLAVDSDGKLIVGRINGSTVAFHDNTTSATEFVTMANTALVANQWYYITVAVSWANSNVMTPTVYVNGESCAVSGTPTTFTGGLNGGTFKHFDIGAGVSAAGLYADTDALSDVNTIKALATNSTYVTPYYAKTWSNLDSTANSATHFSVGSGKNAQMNLNLPSTIDTPVGTVVSISAIKIANGNKTMANTITINGYEGTKKGTTEAFTPKGSVTAGTIDRLYTYEFATPAEVSVGTAYDIGWKNAEGVATYSEVSGVADNSPIGITGLTDQYANHKGYCEIVTTIKSFPALPEMISYTAGDPSDWQSTGVSVAQMDAMDYLKTLANRYEFAATFGNTSMDASPRNGTPLNVTLHSDGVLTVEMQVVNGGFKKAALVGFKVDGGLLKVKRIKSTYAATTFNGPMMTYTNGGLTYASGVDTRGAYVFANVTLTRITKFKDDVAVPDFLSTTAPIIRYDASAYDNFTYNENGEVLGWKDLSASGNNATFPASDTTKGRVEIVNGIPAYEMGAPGSGIDLAFTTRATDIRTVFWVMDIRTDGNKAFFLGDVGNDCCDFHRGERGEYYASGYASEYVKNGTTYCDGSVVANPTGTIPPAGLHVYALKTTGNVSANRLSQDRAQARNGGRAISELVVFNSELTDEQIAAMNKYLLYKWMSLEMGEISATLSEGSQNFSSITWNDGAQFANGNNVTLTADSETTLTIDEEAIVGSLTLTGAGALTINNARNLSFGSVDISGFTGTINYNVDATRAAFTASESLKAFIKDAAHKVVFTFTGSGANGATVDFGGGELNSNPDIGGRLIFSGGTHTLQICHGNVDSGKGSLATGGTIDEPSILATNNATLTYKMKDMCGWKGEFDAGSTVKVDAGSKIKLVHNASNNSMFMRGRLVIVPGGELEIDPTSDDNALAIYGGDKASSDHTNAQIYVPAPAQGAANTVAKITVASGVTRTPIKFHGASAITVEEGATLDISASVKGSEAITKYGDGILRMPNRSDYTGTITVAAGYLDVGELRDFTSLSGITLSGTGGFVIRETSAEYAKADLTVMNPNDYTIKVIRPNGLTIYDLTTVVGDTTVKISGAATSFDVTYTNTLHEAYSNVSGFSSNSDGNNNCTYNNTADDDTTGAYLKHQPHLKGLDADNGFYASTDVLTFAIVGTMPSTENTIFAHFGHSNSDRYGLLLITGTKKDEVLVAWNHGSTVTPITTMSVPNASSARHVYIVTKEDNRTSDTTTFTVYLDGQKWKTLDITPRFTIVGNVQLGGDFWGLIRYKSDSNPTSPYKICDANSGGIVNCVRGYNRIISAAEIAKYSEVYTYSSPNGQSERTFSGETTWIDDAEESSVWANTPAEGEATHSGTPLVGAAIVANLTEDTTITVNVPAEGLAYESFNIKGTGSVTFEKDEDSGSIRSTGMVTIGRPVTVKPGSFDLSTPPITLLEDGDLTFDYSDFDVSEIYVTTKINLTGQIDKNDAKVHFTVPTSLLYHTTEMAYDSSIKQYVLTITPNHQKGDNVYATNKELTSFVTENKTATVLFPTDVVVIKDGYGIDESASRWQISLADAGLTGHKILVNYTRPTSGISVHGVPNGMEIEIATGAKMFFREGKSIGDGVSISGTGTLSIGTPVAINGTVTISSELEFEAGGKFTSGVNGKSVKHENGENNSIVYSLIDTAADPIQPSDDPDAPAVVIDDIGTTGVTLSPGAKVVVPTAADTSKIAVKYTIPGTGTVKDLKADGLVTVAVNQTTGAVELTTTDSAKPAATDIAMSTPTEQIEEEDTDLVRFTIANPIPGLFYEIVSGDSFDEHGALVVDEEAEKGTSQATTSAEAKTVSIPMTFTGGKKVKYYKVSVKATK